MKKDKTDRIRCQGGLGNQLFQLSFALNVSQGNSIELDFVIKEPKDEMKIKYGLDSYRLPSNVGLNISKQMSFLTSKTLNLATRLSTHGSTSAKYLGVLIVKQLIVFVYKILNRKQRELVINEGIGYSIIDNSNLKSREFIGYFQSYQWAEIPKVKKLLFNLELKQKSKWVEKYIGYSEIEIPLVVHLRLGDYLQEPKIGIPSIEYYKNGIDLLWSKGNFTAIWIFTDDENAARSLIGEITGKETRWITDNQDNAAHNLEVMRLGHGYVISNSTFSWWGAFLSRNPDSPVVAPKNWFTGMEDPLDLCPTSWIRI
jgi:hypothetical protein